MVESATHTNKCCDAIVQREYVGRRRRRDLPSGTVSESETQRREVTPTLPVHHRPFTRVFFGGARDRMNE